MLCTRRINEPDVEPVVKSNVTTEKQAEDHISSVPNPLPRFRFRVKDIRGKFDQPEIREIKKTSTIRYDVRRVIDSDILITCQFYAVSCTC